MCKQVACPVQPYFQIVTRRRPAHMLLEQAFDLTAGKADAALIASMTHYGHYTIRQIKEELAAAGVKVRLDY